MNILMISPDKDKIKGGISSVIKSYEESKYLQDINIFYLATSVNGSKIKKINFALIAIFKMIWYMLFKNIDIVHIHTASGVSFYRKSIFIKIASISKKIIILHIHGGGFYDFYVNSSKRNKHKIIKSINRCNCLIVLSESWKRKFENLVSIPIKVINNSVEEKYINPYNTDSKRITFVGRIEYEKGIFELINIAEDIINFDKKVKFIICGDGELDFVKKKVEDLNLEKNFDFLGWISNKEVDYQMENTEIFVLPSHKEAMPISILEAMRNGVPIISTKVGSIPEVIKNYENGILIEKQNEIQLKEAIIEILNNDSLRNIISKNNYNVIKNKYSNKMNHYKIKSIYHDLLNKEVSI